MPFTVDQFFDVFFHYNEETQSFLILFYILALAVCLLFVKKNRFAVKAALLLLALLWLWMGIAYHWSFFQKINPAAKVFAAGFVIQGVLFFILLFLEKIQLRQKLTTLRKITGVSLIAYALILYPLIGFVLGHSYPRGPIFGLPCPTSIFTFGIILFLETSRNYFLAMIFLPLVWSLIGTFAAIHFGVTEDYALLASAGLAVWFSFFKS